MMTPRQRGVYGNAAVVRLSWLTRGYAAARSAQRRPEIRRALLRSDHVDRRTAPIRERAPRAKPETMQG